jgi:hypothetical protein
MKQYLSYTSQIATGAIIISLIGLVIAFQVNHDKRSKPFTTKLTAQTRNLLPADGQRQLHRLDQLRHRHPANGDDQRASDPDPQPPETDPGDASMMPNQPQNSEAMQKVVMAGMKLMYDAKIFP